MLLPTLFTLMSLFSLSSLMASEPNPLDDLQREFLSEMMHVDDPREEDEEDIDTSFMVRDVSRLESFVSEKLTKNGKLKEFKKEMNSFEDLSDFGPPNTEIWDFCIRISSSIEISFEKNVKPIEIDGVLLHSENIQDMYNGHLGQLVEDKTLSSFSQQKFCMEVITSKSIHAMFLRKNIIERKAPNKIIIGIDDSRFIIKNDEEKPIPVCKPTIEWLIKELLYELVVEKCILRFRFVSAEEQIGVLFDSYRTNSLYTAFVEMPFVERKERKEELRGVLGKIDEKLKNRDERLHQYLTSGFELYNVDRCAYGRMKNELAEELNIKHYYLVALQQYITALQLTGLKPFSEDGSIYREEMRISDWWSQQQLVVVAKYDRESADEKVKANALSTLTPTTPALVGDYVNVMTQGGQEAETESIFPFITPRFFMRTNCASLR